MKTMKMKLGAVALVGCALLWALPAHAETVSIGLQQAGVNNGDITTVQTGTGFALFGGNYGTFFNIVSGSGQSVLTDPAIFLSNAQASTGASGTLNVFVTEQDLTSPLGNLNFSTSFTSQTLTSGWTAQVTTLLDPANGQYTGTPVNTVMFTGLDTNVQLGSAATGNGPYSITHEYVINATSSGNAQLNTDMSAAPEPSAILLLGIGLVGLGLSLKRNSLSSRG